VAEVEVEGLDGSNSDDPAVESPSLVTCEVETDGVDIVREYTAPVPEAVTEGASMVSDNELDAKPAAASLEWSPSHEPVGAFEATPLPSRRSRWPFRRKTSSHSPQVAEVEPEGAGNSEHDEPALAVDETPRSVGVESESDEADVLLHRVAPTIDPGAGVASTPQAPTAEQLTSTASTGRNLRPGRRTRKNVRLWLRRRAEAARIGGRYSAQLPVDSATNVTADAVVLSEPTDEDLADVASLESGLDPGPSLPPISDTQESMQDATIEVPEEPSSPPSEQSSDQQDETRDQPDDSNDGGLESDETQGNANGSGTKDATLHGREDGSREHREESVASLSSAATTPGVISSSETLVSRYSPRARPRPVPLERRIANYARKWLREFLEYQPDEIPERQQKLHRPQHDSD
jgi:hypothetical protein